MVGAGSVRAEVQGVLARWAYGYDERDTDTMASCFTPGARMTLHIGDAETMGPYIGHDEVMKHFTDHHEVQTDQRRHVVANVTFEHEDPQRVQTTSCLSLLVVEDGTTRAQATGIYRDTFVLDGGRWVISERILRLDAHY